MWRRGASSAHHMAGFLRNSIQGFDCSFNLCITPSPSTFSTKGDRKAYLEGISRRFRRLKMKNNLGKETMNRTLLLSTIGLAGMALGAIGATYVSAQNAPPQITRTEILRQAMSGAEGKEVV